MANNTIMTAKNTFGDGLLMDFAPDNTQATCLTHALNATLVTMNGNELSLLNDMGNGRVETAYLPEGYVPVGTCEYGGIIYIVSYNPLTNKSLIGCFPSPERNISSDEMGDLSPSFNTSDFINEEEEVIHNSVKKVICSKTLNPGDKFIVYTDSINENESVITDYGNTTHTLDVFPKLVKFSVVAIEDSGKINYLNSNLKWYGSENTSYYINLSASTSQGTPDIDSYRNLLNSGYSVFQSKVSGKLAILAELERIDGFSCTYDVIKVGSRETENINFNDYKVFINFNWNTKNDDINPSFIKISKPEWVSPLGDSAKGTYGIRGFKESSKESIDISNIELNIIPITVPKGYHTSMTSYKSFVESNFLHFITDNLGTKITQCRELGAPVPGSYYIDLASIVEDKGLVTYYDNKGKIINPTTTSDIIVNNYYKSSIYKEAWNKTFEIPNIQTLLDGNNKYTYEVDKKNLILKYTVTPKMEYGYLPDLAVTHYIDFSKVGTGIINLVSYKYFVGENLCTLALGTEIYPEEGKGIEEILLSFYDNLGLCATYHINNRLSYSGNLIEYLPLNGDASNYKLSALDESGLLINHKGIISGTTEDGEPKYENDAGILYSNCLYALKIVFKYKSYNVLELFDSIDTSGYKTEWRWLWTNTMFNDYYYSITDFKDCQLSLLLDTSTKYYANYNYDTRSDYYNPNKVILKDADYSLYKNLAANIQHLNGSIDFTLDIGLLNTYNTFALAGDKANSTGVFSSANGNLTNKVYLGNSKISYSDLKLKSTELESLDTSSLSPTSAVYDIGYYKNIMKSNLDEGNNIWEAKDNHIKFTDQIKFSFKQDLSDTEKGTISYLDSSQEPLNNKELPCFNISTNFQNKIPLYFDLWNFSKYLQLYKETAKNVPVVRPLLNPDTAEELGFYYKDNYGYLLKNVYSIFCVRNNAYGNDKRIRAYKWKLDKIHTILNSDFNAYLDDIDNSDLLYDAMYQENGKGTGSWSQYKDAKNRYIADGIENKTDTGHTVDTLSLLLPVGLFFLHITNITKNIKGVRNGKHTFSLSNNIYNMSEIFFIIGNNARFVQTGYTDENGIHLLNDYTSGFNYLNNSGLPPLSGSANCETALVSCLELTYKIYEHRDVLIREIYNQLINDYLTMYTQDVIYEVRLQSNNNNLLFLNCSYSEYLDAVINSCEQGVTLTKDDSNVKVTFEPIIKNIPVQITVNSLLPSFKAENINVSFESYNSLTPTITNVSPNLLYWINNLNLLTLVGNTLNSWNLKATSGDIMSAEIVSSSYKFRTPISNVFKLQDDVLICKRTSPLQSYSLIGYGWRNSTGDEDRAALCDLLIGDTMLTDCCHVK